MSIDPVLFEPVLEARAFWNRLISQDLRRDPDVARQAIRLAGFSLAMLIWVLVFAVIYFALGAPISAAVVLSAGAIIVGILLALRRGLSPTLCANVFCGAGLYTYTTLALVNGGVGAPATMWYASMPVLAILLSGTRSGIYWTATSILAFSAFALAQELGFTFPTELTPDGLKFLQFTGLVGLVTCISILVCVLKNLENTAQEALHQVNHRLELQASTDGLTGIANRRSFDRALEREWKRHQRTSQPLSVALIDTDLFKQYNDVYGHLAGDDCLRSIAQIIQFSVQRPGDMVARYGGEEFAVIMPNTDERGAAYVVEEIRKQVKSLGLPHPRSSVAPHVTISIGATTVIPTDGASLLDVLHEADVALYRAKANGRDQIIHVLPWLVS